MSFCTKCGKEMQNGTCISCGALSDQKVTYMANREGGANPMAMWALVCAFFIPLLAFILGIVALGKAKKLPEPFTGAGKGYAIAAIVLSSVSMVISVLFVIWYWSIFSGMLWGL